MTPGELIAVFALMPVCVYFSWRSGVRQGASTMIQALHQDDMLTSKAIKVLGLAEE